MGKTMMTCEKSIEAGKAKTSFMSSVSCIISKFLRSSTECEDASCVRCLLSNAPPQKMLRIVGVCGGKGGRKRLSDLGLVETALVKVASSSRLGIILTLSSGGRLAIDRKLADAVTVESL